MNTGFSSYSGDPALASALPGSALQGFSRIRNGRRYELVVVQQPSRARMCGFGDKDRRPLSPTLIAKLVIYDVASGVELHPSEVNTSLFFVTSDLCHPDDLMLAPRNILVNPGGSATGFPGPSSIPPASPSGDESIMSGTGANADLMPTSPPPPAAHFDPHTQTHVYASDLASQSYSHHVPTQSHPGSGPVSDAPTSSWAHHADAMSSSSAIGGGFLPPTSSSSSSYTGAPEVPGADVVGGGSGVGNSSAHPSTFPIATGMAGAYSIGDQPPTPTSAGLPNVEVALGPGPSSGGLLGSYEYHSGASLPPPLGSSVPGGPYPYGAQAQGQINPYGSSTPAQPQQQQQSPYTPTSLNHQHPPTTPLSSVSLTQSLSSENLTRNLVGSAVASANVLKDLDEKVCIFFVLQDISVRTEGVYRIKLMFADLGLNGTVNRGISEALAETYTDAFVVYSPRKFPGMHDPTELSRKLVAQGVKIPVRSDRKKQGRGGGSGHGGGGPSGGGGHGDDDDGDDD
ncbi:hypothetical protein A4X13_0g4266 [Tilletia indica]|uniref:Uncharacterized protein n=1 Tax=Tilletia indica TaxID=43049 RepID=A0A177T902_9BASI|nr:hypothetical protein A4X13_0g4266 [Tilletia indica]